MQGNLNGLLRGRKFKNITDYVFAEARRQYGLRQVEIELLQYLDQVPEATATEICKTMDMNKGHVSQGFDSLCKSGYLTARTHSRDRRYVRYELTDQARTFLKVADEVRDKLEQEVLRGLTEEELAVLHASAEKICGNIDRIYDMLP